VNGERVFPPQPTREYVWGASVQQKSLGLSESSCHFLLSLTECKPLSKRLRQHHNDIYGFSTVPAVISCKPQPAIEKTGQMASRERFRRDAGQTGQKTGRPCKNGTSGNPIPSWSQTCDELVISSDQSPLFYTGCRFINDQDIIMDYRNKFAASLRSWIP